MVRWLALPAFLLVAAARTAWTQEVTGEIEGWVTSESGNPLPEVQVTATGPSLQGARSTLSGSRGYFRLPTLPVGSYRVHLQLLGHRPTTYEDVRVRLATSTTLGRVRLETRALELPEIVVPATVAPIDPTTTATRTTFRSEQLAELPLERNFRSIIALAPQANLSYFGDEVNIAGGTGLENVYFIDGINVTDASNAATSTNLPYNFIKEIEVTTGGYEAEYGRALGGVVNLVTQSGGNEFQGQVYSFLTSDELRTGPRLGLADVNPTDFTSYDVGASLGGPIARDRLWFYAAYNPTFQRSRLSLPGLSPRSASGTQHLLAGKLTWQAGSSSAFVFTVIGDPTEQERLGPLPVNLGSPISLANPEVVDGKLTQGGVNFSLLTRHQLTTRLLLQGSISRFNRRDDNEPRTVLGLTEPLFRDIATGVWSGGYGGANRFRSARTAVGVSLTLDIAPHAVKLGAEYEDNYSALNFQRGAGGGGGGFITQTAPSSYVWREFYTDGRLHIRIPTLYAQDSWQLARRIRLNAGLRWSNQRLMWPDHGLVTRVRDGIQPRAGLVYEPSGPGVAKIFASFGRYAEQLPAWMSQFFGPGRTLFRRFSQDPRIDTTGAVVLLDIDNSEDHEAIASARDAIGETYDEFVLGYEGRIGQRLKLGARGIYRTLRWAVDNRFNPADGTIQFGNPGRGELADAARFTRDYTALELTLERFGNTRFPFVISYVVSRTYGNYTGLFSTDILTPVPNIGPQGDFASQMENGTGLLPNDRTHVLKLFGSYRFDFRLAVGASLLWGSGTPLSQYGAIAEAPNPYWSFVQPRGSVGRTPALWDLSLRLVYELPALWARGRPRVLLDLFHVGNPRHAVTFDQVRYTDVDDDGNQTGASVTYGEVTHYQPPMSARLGLILDF